MCHVVVVKTIDEQRIGPSYYKVFILPALYYLRS